MRRRVSPEGIRITKVGLWYVLLTVVVAVAATNTGNNALYMVLATLLAALVVSGVASRHNVRALDLEVQAPGQIFANRPFRVRFRLANRGYLLPRWFLLVRLEGSGKPLLVPYLRGRGATRGTMEVILPRRGRHRFAAGHLSSLFPFGLFRKGARHRLDLEVLVYPELYPAGTRRAEPSAHPGRGPSRRALWGHELHALRAFRQGDDPRGIHWKQTARTGELVFMEREAERGRRLAILLDNGVGEAQVGAARAGSAGAEAGAPGVDFRDPADRARFEGLVSEAATAAVDHLARGFEVELVTRDRALPFAGGLRQRLAVLEALALVEPVPRQDRPLRASDPLAARLRLSLERELAA